MTMTFDPTTVVKLGFSASWFDIRYTTAEVYCPGVARISKKKGENDRTDEKGKDKSGKKDSVEVPEDREPIRSK